MFDRIIGNEPVKKILRRLVAGRRVPNSLLFAGENSIGKRLFAVEIAKSFVCREPLENNAPCGKCVSCRRVGTFNIPAPTDKNKDEFKKVFYGEHPDIGLIAPYKKTILVDAIRSLEREANFRPFEARARIFLIDPADRMNDEAANALLKTLEEPPPSTYIFLLTARPDALLPTIHSRCQTLRFAPLDTAEIEKYLLETKEYSPDDAALLARAADGKLGYALNLDAEKFRRRRETMMKVLESLLSSKNRAVLLQTAEEMTDAKNKDEYEDYLDALQILIHDAWALYCGAGAEKIVNADFFNQLQRLVNASDANDYAAWLTEIETLRGNFTVNLNRKIATDALFLQMAGA